MAGLPSRNKSLPNIFALAGVVLAVAGKRLRRNFILIEKYGIE